MTCGRQAGNVSASDDKVVAPGVSTRIEQCRHSERAGIDAREVRPFVRVAAVAGERQAAGIVGATVRPRYTYDTMCSTWKLIRGVASCVMRQYSHALPARLRTTSRNLGSVNLGPWTPRDLSALRWRLRI